MQSLHACPELLYLQVWAMGFTVADSGGTVHMFPDKSIFIFYKPIWNLQVKMDANAFLLVLGCGTAIISLNSQEDLVWNGSLALCSRSHFNLQPMGSFSATRLQLSWISRGWYDGVLPYFCAPVDTSSDCHLAYEPLGCSVLLDTVLSLVILKRGNKQMIKIRVSLL
jgi:hypothetical protein